MRFGWAWAGLIGMTGQGWAEGLSAPQEPPSAGYAGQSYVDSRGCMFLRAGDDGHVIWLPRIGRERKAMCGFAPNDPGRAAQLQVQVGTFGVPANAEGVVTALQAAGLPAGLETITLDGRDLQTVLAGPFADAASAAAALDTIRAAFPDAFVR
jgi:SPOR domain